MEKLTVEQIIQKIENQETFEAVSSNYSFTLKIEDYVHYLCGAVHDGTHFRQELWDNCTHSYYERWFEEDPATKAMVQSHPIVIAGLDSRFEYDLNRAPDTAIYEDAWGKTLWKKPLTASEKAISLAKHNDFYRVVHALMTQLENLHDVCIVYDMHSYNKERWDRAVPTWNLGTTNVDNERFGEDIEIWRQVLENMPLPKGIPSTSKINDTFFGNGYFLKYITQNFKNTLVLATEIAKVYCDELRQVMYPEVILAVEAYLKTALKKNAYAFYERHKA